MKKTALIIVMFLFITNIHGQAVNNFINKVFYFAPGIDTSQGQVLAECDCCTENTMFYSATEFITTSYCMANATITNGTYLVKNGVVKLNYSGKYVSKTLDEEWEAKTNGKGKQKYTVTTYKEKSFTNKIKPIIVGQVKFYLKEDEIPLYGEHDKNESVNKLINELKKSGLWKRLFS